MEKEDLQKLLESNAYCPEEDQSTIIGLQERNKTLMEKINEVQSKNRCLEMLMTNDQNIKNLASQYKQVMMSSKTNREQVELFLSSMSLESTNLNSHSTVYLLNSLEKVNGELLPLEFLKLQMDLLSIFHEETVELDLEINNCKELLEKIRKRLMKIELQDRLSTF